MDTFSKVMIGLAIFAVPYMALGMWVGRKRKRIRLEREGQGLDMSFECFRRQFEGRGYSEVVIETVHADLVDIIGFPILPGDELKDIGSDIKDLVYDLEDHWEKRTGQKKVPDQIWQMPLVKVEDYAKILTVVFSYNEDLSSNFSIH